MDTPHIQYVRSADGTNIAFSETGAGVPLVLSCNIWDDLGLTSATFRDPETLRRLADQGLHTVRYNMRGMGMSDREPRDFSIDAQLDDLEAVRERLGFERFALYGFVHATPACIAYAARNPGRLTHLLLELPFANGEAWYQAVPTLKGLESFRALGDEQWELYTLTHAAALTSRMHNDADEFAARMRRCTSPETLRRYLAALRTQDVTPYLGAIRAPTLVIVRDPEGIGGQFSRTIARAIPGSRLATRDIGTGLPLQGDAELVAQFVLGRAAAPVRRTAPGQPADSPGTAVILFTDIVSSTELTERMGDARFRDASRALDTGLRAAIREAGGAAIDGKVLGDGVLATFPSAAQAIDGARRCLALSAASYLGLHIGLHAGDVIHEDNNVYGGAVNIASRLCGLSAPGEILVSDVVRGMARTSAGVVFEDRGEHALKGIAEAVRVYAVRGEQ